MTFLDLAVSEDGGPGRFLRDGQPHTIVSGALHYFRVPRALWGDRLQRLAAMGCNTVETYVAWNFHVRRPDAEPDLTGDRDLGAFLDEAGRQGLDVLVRPGPYICAEWDLGGLPSWLLAEEGLRTRERGVNLRTADPAWLRHVDAWFDRLIPVIGSRQVSQGGPVVAVQVENEYGSFGDDRGYLQHLADGLRARGITELLFTSDGPSSLMLRGGTLDDVLATVNFGSRSTQAFSTLLAERPGTPTMVMEFWNGWFDHWGGPHHVRDAQDAAAELDTMLAGGHSVNFYMGHGGTSFGVWAGANAADDGTLQPTVSSYDYDAPIAEDGTLTPKFWAFREVVAARTGRELPEPPAPAPRQRPRDVELTGPVLGLEQVLDAVAPVRAAAPPSMEDLGIHHGVVRYRTEVAGPEQATLTLPGVGDLAAVRLTGPDGQQQQGLVSQLRVDPAFVDRVELDVAAGTSQLDVVVASLGRVNFGPLLGDRKGLHSARLSYQHLFGWSAQGLDLTELPELDWSAAADGRTDGPCFQRVELEVDSPADAWLSVPDGHHGYLFLNGFNLGRYWNPAGPTQALYAPAPLWRTGVNEVVVCELVRPGRRLQVLDEPRLGPAESAPAS
ncbi:beta-galactosidase [Auraticoccus sp. F435]|uniref:Beta-galactosidase n=1 Tax=Auraticoccus cholistanensis TaxID=2656650 RepID=A0A6A9UV04_9ACTN|nr:beta-galactosidase family protein [Auraticoccus cholistanensis]MVA76776.1 beta-galactosidase [Auraticoccus cholistanensis]